MIEPEIVVPTVMELRMLNLYWRYRVETLRPHYLFEQEFVELSSPPSLSTETHFG